MTDRAERRFHQLVIAGALGLALMIAWALAAPWLVTLIVVVLAAGSISPGWSLTRRFHRYFVAPLDPESPTEDPTSFLRADGLLSVIAFAGAVFVIAGVPPLGWALVGLATLDLLLDGLADAAPIRRLLDRAVQRSRAGE
ncbi:MAG: DUF4395 family protein [Chloroflexota bacterium]|nr:DUF4395 family protein [Chloroflexota bacterium]